MKSKRKPVLKNVELLMRSANSGGLNYISQILLCTTGIFAVSKRAMVSELSLHDQIQFIETMSNEETRSV